MNTHTKPLPGIANPTRKVAYAVVLVAMGIALAPYTSFPIGIAKVNPTQHFINLLGAVLLGPWWAALVALVIGILRNALGVGTLLAFPGGMIGAFLAGWGYRWTRRIYAGAAGEIIGTGILAPIVCALWVAPVLMGKALPLLALAPSFLASTVTGTLLGVLALGLLQRADIIDLGN